MKLLKSREIVIHPDDEGLVDNRVRAFKTKSDYRVISEGEVFGVFPLTPGGWTRALDCFERTFQQKQLEFDRLRSGRKSMDKLKNQMIKPDPGSKWRHYKNGAVYEVAAVAKTQMPRRSDQWIVRPEIYRYANNPDISVQLWRTPLGIVYLCDDTYFDCPMVFYRGESGQWCRTLYDFCGLGDNGEKRFIEVEK